MSDPQKPPRAENIRLPVFQSPVGFEKSIVPRGFPDEVKHEHLGLEGQKEDTSNHLHNMINNYILSAVERCKFVCKESHVAKALIH